MSQQMAEMPKNVSVPAGAKDVSQAAGAPNLSVARGAPNLSVPQMPKNVSVALGVKQGAAIHNPPVHPAYSSIPYALVRDARRSQE